MAATIRSAFRTEHDLDAAERSSGYGDTIRLNETLLSQPRKRGELIVQVIRRQQPHHGFGACRDATILFGCGDLVTNIWAGGRAQTLATPVGPKEHPSMAREHWTECIESGFADHALGTPVVINDSGKRPLPFRPVHYSVKGDVATRKRDVVGP